MFFQMGEREKPKVVKKPSLTELVGKEEAASKPGLVRRPSGSSLFGTTEVDKDFVMVDLKTPFAPPPSV